MPAFNARPVPVADRGKRFVAIVGRTFNSAENYRKATDRTIAGDWKQFSPNEFFENVLIAGSLAAIDRAASELSKYQVSRRKQSGSEEPTTEDRQTGRTAGCAR
jgi:hypothetical protein